jgi:hypothetical protein
MPTFALMLWMLCLPAATPQTRDADEALWTEIAALIARPSTSQPFDRVAPAEIARREQLLARAAQYLSLYPGGRRRDEIIRLELRTQFELGALRGGDFAPLCEAAQRYARAAPSDAVAAETAYWQIVCARLAQTRATSQPATADLDQIERELLPQYEAYLTRFPRSPYAPRLATLLFEHAQRRGDEPEMRKHAALLRDHFPEHAATALLAAQLRRRETVGRPFWITFTRLDGATCDSREWAGRPVLIVVWSAADARARETLAAADRLRRENPALAVCGVCVDGDPVAGQAAAAALNLDWPQCFDRLGWASECCREWGVRTVPFVFAIDRTGRLRGATDGPDWPDLAAAILRN